MGIGRAVTSSGSLGHEALGSHSVISYHVRRDRLSITGWILDGKYSVLKLSLCLQARVSCT